MALNLQTILKNAKNNVQRGMTQHNAIHDMCNVLWVNGIRVHMDMASEQASEQAIEQPSEKPIDDSHAAAEEEVAPTELQTEKVGNKTTVPFDVVRNKDGSYTMDINGNGSRKNTMVSEVPNVPPLVIDQTRLITRVILCDNKNKRASNALWNECLGVIIDTINWKVLSVPSNSLLYRPSKDVVNKRLKRQDYDIMPIIDGTSLTLYNWDHPEIGSMWSLASRNGYDVSTLKQRGSKTYSELVFDLFERFYPEFVASTGMSLLADKHLAFESLSKQSCYTFIFRHHDQHPVIADAEGIWQVQSVNLKTMQKTQGAGLGPNSPPGQSSIPSNASMTFNDFAGNNSGYGFILHCRKGPGPDIVIESQRLLDIKKLVYNVPKDNAEPEEIVKYAAFRAYLMGSPNREKFTKYYPEWISIFHSIREFVVSTAHTVISAIRNPDLTRTQLITDIIQHIEDTPACAELITNINDETHAILVDIIMNTRFALALLREMP